MPITPDDVKSIDRDQSGQENCKVNDPLLRGWQVGGQWSPQLRSFLFSILAMILLFAGPSRSETETLDELLAERVALSEELGLFISEYQRHAKAFQDARMETTENALRAFIRTGALLVDLVENRAKKSGSADDYSSLLDASVDAIRSIGTGLMASIDSQRAYPLAVASLQAINDTLDRMEQIDLQIAAGVYREAEERLYLVPEEIEIPCPPDAVPLAPIGEEGKCYEERFPERGIYGTPVAQMMSDEAAYEIFSFCDARPDALFCQVGASPGRFGAYCEGPNPAEGCLPSSSGPARLGGYCEGDNPAPDCLPTNP